MALGDVIDAVHRSERTLTVFNPEDETVVEELSERLVDRNVSVQTETTESGRPVALAVLDLDGVVLATVEVASLRALLDDTATTSGLGFETEGYSELLQYLQEATFTSYDRRRMLDATREIEDRAFRIGAGRFRAGFQTLDRLATERDRYAELADRGLTVTAYATPGGERPEIPGVRIVTPDTAEIATHWFVAFDGAGDDAQKCALLAAEREDGFYGVWTYDPETVDWIQAHLSDRYDR